MFAGNIPVGSVSRKIRESTIRQQKAPAANALRHSDGDASNDRCLGFLASGVVRRREDQSRAIISFFSDEVSEEHTAEREHSQVVLNPVYHGEAKRAKQIKSGSRAFV